jgi:hypothetical protein
MQRVNKESIDILKDVFYESWKIKSSGWGLQSGDCRTFEIKEDININIYIFFYYLLKELNKKWVKIFYYN